jgi:hypothetical protein
MLRAIDHENAIDHDGSNSLIHPFPCFIIPCCFYDVTQEWTWQCGDAVQFGPKADKICPLTVPVPKPQGISNGITFTEAQQSVPVPCDVNIHPTGHRGNEVCGYSECGNDDDDGSFSAVCGCVDLGARGVENGGMVWICLHSTCRCGSDETPAAAPAASGVTTATAGWSAVIAATASAAVAMLA